MLLAIGPVCERLPKKMKRLGDAFAPFWESGTVDDCTKITAALFPSLEHWGAFQAEDKKPFIERVVGALKNQPWQKMAVSEMTAAAFGCAIARLGEPASALSHVLGNLVRGKGQPTAEACGGIVLAWINDIGDPETERLIRATLQGRRDFLRSIDPLVGVYLSRLNLPIGYEPSWGKVEFNPNRALALGQWAGNLPFQEFVKTVIDVCELVKRGEPYRRSTITELQRLAERAQAAAGIGGRKPAHELHSRPFEFSPIGSVDDLTRSSSSRSTRRAERNAERLDMPDVPAGGTAAFKTTNPPNTAPEEMIVEALSERSAETLEANKATPRTNAPIAETSLATAEVEAGPATAIVTLASGEPEARLSAQRPRLAEEIERDANDAEQRAYAAARQRAATERAARRQSTGSPAAEAKPGTSQANQDRNSEAKKRGFFGWLLRSK